MTPMDSKQESETSTRERWYIGEKGVQGLSPCVCTWEALCFSIQLHTGVQA